MNIFDTQKGKEALESLIQSIEDLAESVKTLNTNIEKLIEKKEEEIQILDRYWYKDIRENETRRSNSWESR